MKLRRVFAILTNCVGILAFVDAVFLVMGIGIPLMHWQVAHKPVTGTLCLLAGSLLWSGRRFSSAVAMVAWAMVAIWALPFVVGYAISVGS
jgi:hypothetical protein